MKREEFEVGQRVKQYDENEGCYVYGHVVEILPESIKIKWSDIISICECEEWEYPEIKKGNPGS